MSFAYSFRGPFLGIFTSSSLFEYFSSRLVLIYLLILNADACTGAGYLLFAQVAVVLFPDNIFRLPSLSFVLLA